jgi:hypothetical protein
METKDKDGNAMAGGRPGSISRGELPKKYTRSGKFECATVGVGRGGGRGRDCVGRGVIFPDLEGEDPQRSSASTCCRNN